MRARSSAWPCPYLLAVTVSLPTSTNTQASPPTRHSLHTNGRRRLLGPNLKTLALLMLPVPLLLYPVLVAVGGIFSGTAVAFANAAQLPKDTSCGCSSFVFLHTCT